MVEVGEQVGEVVGRAGDHHADGNAPAHKAGELVDRESRSSRRSECSSRIEENSRARLGQSHGSARTVKQVLAELSLEPADLGTDSRLGDVKPGGGSREACLVGHGNEVRELSEFHNQTC
jgi:hypothetical protein